MTPPRTRPSPPPSASTTSAARGRRARWQRGGPRALLLAPLLAAPGAAAAAMEPAAAAEVETTGSETATAEAGRRELGREGLSFLDTGPLRIRDPFLPGLGFLALDPTSADVLDRGDWQLDLLYTLTNSFAQSDPVEKLLKQRDGRAPLTLEQLRDVEAKNDADPGIFAVDGETQRFVLALRRGLGPGIQLELLIPVHDFSGGVLDGLVEGFHDLTGFDQSGRLGVPRDDFLLYFRNGDFEVFHDRSPGTALGDVVVGAKGRLSGPGAWDLALEGLVKLPTGDEERLSGSGAVDLGLNLLATRYYARSCLHLAVGVSHLGAAETVGTDDQLLASAMIGYERAIGSAASWVAQLSVSQSPFTDLDVDSLESVTYLVDVGIKKGIGPKLILFAAISENLVNLKNSPDIGFHAGVTKRW